MKSQTRQVLDFVSNLPVARVEEIEMNLPHLSSEEIGKILSELKADCMKPHNERNYGYYVWNNSLVFHMDDYNLVDPSPLPKKEKRRWNKRK